MFVEKKLMTFYLGFEFEKKVQVRNGPQKMPEHIFTVVFYFFVMSPRRQFQDTLHERQIDYLTIDLLFQDILENFSLAEEFEQIYINK